MAEIEKKAGGAVGAGRGLLFITGAKLWFMVAGYAIAFGLPRALGSPDKYGVWSVVLSFVSLFNNVMVTASIQTVSRFIAQVPTRAGSVARAALRRNLIGGAVLVAAFAGGAPLVAAALHDPAYTSYFRVAGIVSGCYAVYAVYVGIANGQRQFQKQAGLDITFATLRAGLVIFAAHQTGSVLAALGGFAGAAVLILLLAAVWVGLGARSHERFAAGELERYFGWVAVYLALVNLVMFIDTFLLKRMVTIAAETPLNTHAAAAGDTAAGLYNAAQTIARLPYQLILAVTFVIFPIMSRATFDADADRARRYVVVTMRYSLIVVGLMAATLAARPAAILRVLFPADYVHAAAALPILAAGYVAFSLFNILGTILNSAGETRAALVSGVVTVAVCVAAVWGGLTLAIARGIEPALAAATGTTSAMIVGMLLAGGAVRRRFGAVLPTATALRVLLATAACAAVGRAWPTAGFLGGKVGTLLSLGAIGLAFLAVVSPDLRPSELRRLRAELR